MLKRVRTYFDKKRESQKFLRLLRKWCSLRFKNVHLVKEGGIKVFEIIKKRINYDEVAMFFDEDDCLQIIWARGKEWNDEEIEKDVQRLIEIEKQRE